MSTAPEGSQVGEIHEHELVDGSCAACEQIVLETAARHRAERTVPLSTVDRAIVEQVAAEVTAEALPKIRKIHEGALNRARSARVGLAAQLTATDRAIAMRELSLQILDDRARAVLAALAAPGGEGA